MRADSLRHSENMITGGVDCNMYGSCPFKERISPSNNTIV